MKNSNTCKHPFRAVEYYSPESFKCWDCGNIYVKSDFNMEKHKILYYYENALKDYTRPRWKRFLFGDKHTHGGLCYYFTHRFGLNPWYVNKLIQFSDRFRFTPKHRAWHYENRKQRIVGIKRVINYLKLHNE